MMGITDCLIFSLYISVIICSQFKKGKKNRKFLITKGFPSIIESTRRRRTSGGRSTATTGAERRHSNRSSPAGLEHRKKSHPSDVFLCISLRARDGIRTRDPRLGKAILHH